MLKQSAIWRVKKSAECSLVLGNSLKLRVLEYPPIKTVFGHCQRTSFWLDNWHPLGPYVTFSEKMPKSFRLSKKSIVAEFCGW